MGKHAQRGRVLPPERSRRGRLFQHRYPVLAAGAVLAVAGVSALLLSAGTPATSLLSGAGTPATSAPAGSEAQAFVSSAAITGGGCSFTSLCEGEGGQQPQVGNGFGNLGNNNRRNHHQRPTATPTFSTTSPAAPPTKGPVTPTVTPTVTQTVTPTDTPTTSSPSSTGSGQFFGLAPLGTQLPRSDSYCASQVEPMAENVAANDTANHTVPSGTVAWGPWAQRISFFQDVDGNFTGTTGEILEWAACKWGWDQSYAMAEAVIESTWRQSEVSGGSYGILQVKVSAGGAAPSANSGWGGYPQIQESTALDADAQMAYLRACYDGDTTWLGNGYAAGNAWGCIGSWYSGQWLTSAADGYISRVQAVLSSQGWTKL
jgi:hypothetical protein